MSELWRSIDASDEQNPALFLFLGCVAWARRIESWETLGGDDEAEDAGKCSPEVLLLLGLVGLARRFRLLVSSTFGAEEHAAPPSTVPPFRELRW
jgi:hypothetical protein